MNHISPKGRRRIQKDPLPLFGDFFFPRAMSQADTAQAAFSCRRRQFCLHVHLAAALCLCMVWQILHIF